MIFLLPLLFLVMDEVVAHGGYHETVAKLEKEIQSNPDDSDLYYKLALAHADHDEADLLMKATLDLEARAPGRYPTAYLRGLSLSLSGDFERADETLRKFLNTSPRPAEATLALARVQMNLEDPRAAAESYRRSAELSEFDTPGLYGEWAEALHACKQSPEASKVIDRGIAHLGPRQSLLMTGYHIDSAAGSWDKALERISALEGLAPTPAPWMARRAETLSAAGRNNAADAEWQRLLAHLDSLPNLERGSAQNISLRDQALKALGQSRPARVVAPPTPHQ